MNWMWPWLMSALGWVVVVSSTSAELHVVGMRCEYQQEPLAVESTAPRLSWAVTSDSPGARGESLSAWQIRVASSSEGVTGADADLWDSGKVLSSESLNIPYGGLPLKSRQRCYWSVKIWDQEGRESPWSPPTCWTMGLLEAADWQGTWIAPRDRTPLHVDRDRLDLPPPRHFRHDFQIRRPVRRAIAYVSALGNYRLYLNGQEASDGYFLPGWSDYRKRAYYQAFDVTDALENGANCVGAIVAEGWYAGYVGYGLLVGYGPHKSGKNFYGKVPALLAQIEIEYNDGTRDTVVTNESWLVSEDGPIREADIIMGEHFDARRDDKLWCDSPAAFAELSRVRDIWSWDQVVPAKNNGSIKAPFSDTLGDREVELGFQQPPVLQSYPSEPVRAVKEIRAKRVTQPKPGVYVFDLGENIAGIVRLEVQGQDGQVIQLRYGEMLHPDGSLMTENLRKARATDSYVCAGTVEIESWEPQFTYHGFQYVEVTGLSHPPDLSAVTGIVLTSNLRYESTFSCSDETLTQFWQNARRTQMANFVDIPTDCPQRDERLGWMGDAQAFVRTASYQADVASFFTKWLDDVREAQRDDGAYPDYAPYPMAHGAPGATHGAAWSDAGIICPWTIWKVYGNTRLVQRQWHSMSRFMEWRQAVDPDLRGIKIGNTWGDWLNVNEDTHIEFIDLCYHAYDCQLMEQMALAISDAAAAQIYHDRCSRLQRSFREQYLLPDGSLRIGTQSAHVLALSCGLCPDPSHRRTLAQHLAQRIEASGTRMATGFLGTKSLLPALTANGQHDLACQLFQSRAFPSWGYEVVNGATSVWERWDSFTKEYGFQGVNGNNNASMNSFSHYAFGAVMEWAFRDLAGIDSEQDGFRHVLIQPNIPSPDLKNIDPNVPVLDWVEARYVHPRGMIASRWERSDKSTSLDVVLPPNTTGTVVLAVPPSVEIYEGGKSLQDAHQVQVLPSSERGLALRIGSGTYHFEWHQPPRNK